MRPWNGYAVEKAVEIISAKLMPQNPMHLLYWSNPFWV